MESTKRRKTSFPKKLENADLHEAVLHKTMATHQ